MPRRHTPLKKATEREIAWALVLVYLDDDSFLAVEDRSEWHPMLLEVIDKIQALKLALEVACRLDGVADPKQLRAKAYERIISGKNIPA